jgi:hypothetical protein
MCLVPSTSLVFSCFRCSTYELGPLYLGWRDARLEALALAIVCKKCLVRSVLFVKMVLDNKLRFEGVQPVNSSQNRSQMEQLIPAADVQ